MARDKGEYWYLKLKDDFYDSEEIVLLENMQDGYLYSNILMKMYLKSLKYDGRLMFRDVIPYSPEMIASITGHQVGTVQKALQIMEQMGLIEVLDNGAIYMTDIQTLIGKSSDEADRKKDYRRRIEQEKSSLQSSKENLLDIKDNSIEYMGGQMSDKCPDKCPPKKRASRFSPPTIEEVRAYCEERGNNVDAEKFIDFYTSNGWKVGKNSMKDWKAAVRTWERNGYSTTSSQKQETYGERRQRETMEMLQAWKDQADTML